jgi:amidohydrolase
MAQGASASRIKAIVLAFSCLAVAASHVARASGPSVDSVIPLVRSTYRYLHENPETGHRESAARDRILAELKRLGGFEFHDVSSLPTEVIAVYDTRRRGPTIALRAELDARPLETGVNEPQTHDPRSGRAGFMHNCGHDAHAAMLLGAAAYIRAHESQFRGKIVFVFQPAEETRGGADDIVADGVLRRLGVQAIYAQHSAPGVPVGTYTLTAGPALAGSANFTAKLSGRSSHAAAPFEGDDLAVIAARFIQELAYFPARNLDVANRPVVVSVAKLISNATTTNLLPSEVTLEGTIRAFEAIVSDDAGSLARQLSDRVRQLGAAYGIDATLEVRPGAPPTINDERLFNLVVPRLRERFGDALKTPLTRGMFAEDFAYYTSSVPALYFGLGVSKDGLGDKPVHTPDFTIHPDALEAGTELLVELARLSPVVK